MTQKQIDVVIDAFARSAVNAKKSDVTAWNCTARTGTGSISSSGARRISGQTSTGAISASERCAVEIVHEVRRRCGPNFPISLRFSQWKFADYAMKLLESPQELEQFLTPLIDAGVDIFHASTRRYWDAAFEGSRSGWRDGPRRSQADP
jgi:2,4-dienoyl-CoA reductase-like NADH-dependent reductase (Old Yellow Enzyme family)